MQNLQQEEVTSPVEEMKLAHELTLLFSGIDIGIAVYNKDHHLLTANDSFYQLHGMAVNEVSIGTHINDVIRSAVAAKNLAGVDIDDTIARSMSCIHNDEKYTSNVQNAHNQTVHVCRYRRSNGMVVETIQALEIDTETLRLPTNGTFSHAYHLKLVDLMNAVNSMNDGLALFDSDGVLVAFNNKYKLLNPAASDVIEVGATHEDIVGEIYDSGEIDFGDLSRQEFMEFAKQQRLKPQGVTSHQNKDGCWVSFAGRRLDNGYTVFTSSDISAMKEHESEKKRLGDTVESQRQHLNDALGNMSQGICVFDSEQCMVVSNQQFINMAGFDPDQAKPGAKRIDLIHGAIERGHYVGDEASFVLKKHIQEGFPKDESTYLYHLFDGRIIEVHNKSLSDGRTIVTNTDVTQRETDAAIIAEQAQQFTDALRNMSQGLALFDADNRLILNNEQYLDMTGIERSLAVPGTMRIELLRSAVNGGQYTPEKASETLEKYEREGFPRSDSTYLHYLANGNIIEISNKPLEDGSTIVTSANVTRRENDATRLAKYTLSLERSNAELQDFAYVASHDLQEPLRKIEAFGDRLAKKYGGQIPEDGAMYLDRMQNAASRMRQLINDLLSYSRVTSKARPFDPTDLNVVVEGVLSDIQMRLEDTGGKVEVTGLETIDCDASQMRQLFQNLISNALKFQKEGVQPHIHVKGELLKDNDSFGSDITVHRIQIIDNGIGFESRFKDQIFAIFKRLHGRMEYEGTGIGLSTCRKIVERHHGFIEADGVPDVGATFTIDIPVKNKAEGE